MIAVGPWQPQKAPGSKYSLPEWRVGRLIAALTKAKRFLARDEGEQRYKGYGYGVCTAAHRAKDAGLMSQDALVDLKNFLRWKLAGHLYVTDFVASCYGIHTAYFNAITSTEERQAYRHRWVDAMIKELAE